MSGDRLILVKEPSRAGEFLGKARSELALGLDLDALLLGGDSLRLLGRYSSAAEYYWSVVVAFPSQWGSRDRDEQACTGALVQLAQSLAGLGLVIPDLWGGYTDAPTPPESSEAFRIAVDLNEVLEIRSRISKLASVKTGEALELSLNSLLTGIRSLPSTLLLAVADRVVRARDPLFPRVTITARLRDSAQSVFSDLIEIQSRAPGEQRELFRGLRLDPIADSVLRESLGAWIAAGTPALRCQFMR